MNIKIRLEFSSWPSLQQEFLIKEGLPLLTNFLAITRTTTAAGRWVDMKGRILWSRRSFRQWRAGNHVWDTALPSIPPSSPSLSTITFMKERILRRPEESRAMTENQHQTQASEVTIWHKNNFCVFHVLVFFGKFLFNKNVRINSCSKWISSLWGDKLWQVLFLCFPCIGAKI